MSAAIAPRLALRQSRVVIQRRAASSTSEAASQGAAKAKETASETASKAQQGLSKVTSSAGSSVSKAGSAVASTLNSIGGRTGRVISFAQGLVPPTIYYARVAGELGRIVFQGQKMSPPTMQTVQSYLTPVQNALRNPSSLLNQTANQAGKQAEKTAQQAVQNPEGMMERLRNMDRATLAAAGVVGAEMLGFFSVGEMIGRFKMVGYRTDASVHAHH